MDAPNCPTNTRADFGGLGLRKGKKGKNTQVSGPSVSLEWVGQPKWSPPQSDEFETHPDLVLAPGAPGASHCVEPPAVEFLDGLCDPLGRLEVDVCVACLPRLGPLPVARGDLCSHSISNHSLLDSTWDSGHEKKMGTESVGEGGGWFSHIFQDVSVSFDGEFATSRHQL